MQIIEVFNYENNYSRSVWSNDIVLKPGELYTDYDSLSLAMKMYVERDDDHDFYPLERFYRF
jgi:hypothetical protein